jgi:predicted RNA-binding Zn-ribbon protein involved in translation (DUF1610 family)
MSNSAVPNDFQLIVYSDTEWDKITSDTTLVTEIPDSKYDVWKCPKCKRIFVYNDQSWDTPIVVYAVEQ